MNSTIKNILVVVFGLNETKNIRKLLTMVIDRRIILIVLGKR